MKSELQGDPSRRIFHQFHNPLLAGVIDGGDRPGESQAGFDATVGIEDRRSRAANAQTVFFVVDGITKFAGALQLLEQLGDDSDSPGSVFIQRSLPNKDFNVL